MTGKNDETNKLRCSFCGKTQDQVKKLIAGPNVYKGLPPYQSPA